MKFDFDQGLPVWVWGILFLVVVLPFSFRSTQPDPNLGPVDVRESVQDSPADPLVDSEPTVVVAPALETVDVNAGPDSNVTIELAPTNTPDPDATEPVIIEVVPLPESAYPEPEIDASQGYE